MNIGEALAAARTQIPPGEARLLLGHVLQQPAAWLEIHRDDCLTTEAATRYSTLVGRRAAGEPVAYLLGKREFYGRDFSVSPAVLIPRPETELLVDIACEKVGAGSTACILDLGTGSGCIAITLALELPGAQVTACDVSSAALELARENARRLGAAVDFVASDWFSALSPRRHDLIVANPPYVAAGDPHLRAGDLRHEPIDALTDHADGLMAIRRIVADAGHWLRPGGWLLMEHGYDQAEAVLGLLHAEGFASVEQHKDLAGITRVSGGMIPYQFSQTLSGAPT